MRLPVPDRNLTAENSRRFVGKREAAAATSAAKQGAVLAPARRDFLLMPASVNAEYIWNEENKSLYDG